MSRRVVICALARTDCAAFIAAAAASRRLHAPWVSPPLTTEAFHALLRNMRPPANHALLARKRDNGALVGYVGVSNIVRGAFRSAYLGYYAFAGNERQGLMREALTLVSRLAFGELGLHRLEANIQPANVASIALARACGFSREGYSPDYLKIRGRWRDHERWALLAGGRGRAGREPAVALPSIRAGQPVVRPAMRADAAEFARLAAQWGYPTPDEAISARLARMLSSSAHMAFVAEREGGLLGWGTCEVRLSMASDPRVEITGLVVDSAARRGGVGRLLVAQMEAWAGQRGCQQIFLRTNVARAESHPFYESLGFARTKTQHAYSKDLPAFVARGQVS